MEPLIEIRDLRVAASSSNGAEIEIVKGVSFAVKRGEVMGLIGESGSGKTTIALAVMGYTRLGCRIAGGSIRIGGTEVTGLDAKGLATAPVATRRPRQRRSSCSARSRFPIRKRSGCAIRIRSPAASFSG